MVQNRINQAQETFVNFSQRVNDTLQLLIQAIEHLGDRVDNIERRDQNGASQ